jgi:hypothetical protein
MTRLEFGFEEESSEKPDEVAQQLIESGFAPNDFLLKPNGLRNSHADSLPSWLFPFPLDFVERQDGEPTSRLLLRHPAFADHPFFPEVVARTGVIPV